MLNKILPPGSSLPTPGIVQVVALVLCALEGLLHPSQPLLCPQPLLHTVLTPSISIICGFSLSPVYDSRQVLDWTYPANKDWPLWKGCL